MMQRQLPPQAAPLLLSCTRGRMRRRRDKLAEKDAGLGPHSHGGGTSRPLRVGNGWSGIRSWKLNPPANRNAAGLEAATPVSSQTPKTGLQLLRDPHQTLLWLPKMAGWDGHHAHGPTKTLKFSFQMYKAQSEQHNQVSPYVSGEETSILFSHQGEL